MVVQDFGGGGGVNKVLVVYVKMASMDTKQILPMVNC